MLCFVWFFVGCFKNEEESVQEVSAPQPLGLESKKDSVQETPLQKELKKNLKSHLDALSKDLQAKNLQHLQIEDNKALQKHLKTFENFQGVGDSTLPKENDATPKSNLQKAYLLQQTQIEKLRQKNDAITK